MSRVTLNQYQGLCEAVAVLLWVPCLSLVCLPCCLQCSQQPQFLEMLWMPSSWAGPTAWQERDPDWDTTSQEYLRGRRGDRQNHEAKAEEMVIANHPSPPNKVGNQAQNGTSALATIDSLCLMEAEVLTTRIWIKRRKLTWFQHLVQAFPQVSRRLKKPLLL